MPSLTNYDPFSTSAIVRGLPLFVGTRRELPPPPEEVSVTGNARNATSTTPSRQEQTAVKDFEEGTNLYDAANPFPRFFTCVISLGDLQADWNSYNSAPPNRTARFWAHRVLDQLMQLNFAPLTVGASSDEGVAFFFRTDSKRASIECLNNGDILAVVSAHREPPDVWSISQDHIGHAIKRIRAFLESR